MPPSEIHALDPNDRALAFAQAERERAAVIALGADLSVVSVEILVFKGIHLAFAVADAPERRLCLDADVLVVGGGFDQAAARIRALSRWKLHDANYSTYGATLRETGAYVDIHRWAMPPRFGHFDVAAARSRARVVPAVFGPYVLVPDALDAAVLAVANYTKDLLGFIGHGMLGEDLALLEEREHITPTALAERLTEHGLRRVGLLALLTIAESDPRWTKYRDACARSSRETMALETVARSLPPLAARSERLAFLAVRAVGDDLRSSLASGALAGARLLRDKYWSR